MSKEEFYHSWDMNMVADAMRFCTHVKNGQTCSGLPKEVLDDIMEKEQQAGLYADGIKWGN